MAFSIDAQPVVSIRQKADPATLSLGSIVYLWRKQAQAVAFEQLRLPPSQCGPHCRVLEDFGGLETKLAINSPSKLACFGALLGSVMRGKSRKGKGFGLLTSKLTRQRSGVRVSSCL